MLRYGMDTMVNVDLYSAIINALNTFVSGEKPGFQALSKGLVVLLCAEVVRHGFPDHGAVHSTANARRPTVYSRYRGTTISCCVADLRRCLPTTSVTGVQQSTRYGGALPCRLFASARHSRSLLSGVACSESGSINRPTPRP